VTSRRAAGPGARRVASPAEPVRTAPRPGMFPAMYAPLIGGFVVFVLIAVFIGWVLDTSRHGDSGRDGH
jgi:hypothetical protein